MSLILYINGQRVEMDANSVIAQTKQVNDLSSLETRQNNYTNTFKLPKTGTNRKIFEHMTVTGNVSSVPYRKNECSLYSGETGECFVYKGWAMVSDDGERYAVNIYDGIMDLYKCISNKTLADIGLTDLDHEKNVSTVMQSWANYQAGDTPYLYIAADYNGNTGTANNVNIDYMVPSVNVKWLWDRIFAYLNETDLPGVSYSGAIFNTFNFKNLWMTYPKGVTAPGTGELYFASGNMDFSYFLYGWYIDFLNTTTNQGQLVNNRFVKPGVTGSYKVRVKGKIDTIASGSLPPSTKIQLGFNRESLPNNSPVTGVLTVQDNIQSGSDFDITSLPFDMSSTDSISLILTRGSDTVTSGYTILNSSNIDLVEITLLDGAQIEFGNELADFSIRDFMTEVVQRFGLTIFKDKFTQHYKYLTLQELLQNAEVTDWSEKYASKNAENYMYGTYCRRNWFRYNYNDKESAHHDGYMAIENVNLLDTKDVIKSKIYAPERILSDYLQDKSNVYKLWDKEITNEQTVTYKPLDKRYYFLRAKGEARNVNVYSEELGTPNTPAAYIFRENYHMLPFQEIISAYYGNLMRIFERTMIVNANLWLNDIDVANIRFDKLVWIEQLSNYFMINKIENYIPGRITKCELVRVLYSAQPEAPAPITINKVIVNGYNVKVSFALTQAFQYLTLEFKHPTETEWNAFGQFPAEINPKEYQFTPLAGIYQIRLRYGDYISNVVEFNMPSNQTITP